MGGKSLRMPKSLRIFSQAAPKWYCQTRFTITGHRERIGRRSNHPSHFQSTASLMKRLAFLAGNHGGELLRGTILPWFA